MRFRQRYPWGGIAGVLLLATSVYSAREYYQYNGSGAWESVNYVDFDTYTPLGTDSWPKLNFNPPLGDDYIVKYYEHNFYTPNTGTTCYEVETQAYNGDPANNDTRFWVGYYDGNNNLVYRSLDDDGGAGRYSKARIYLGISGQIKFYVSAFDKNFNSIKFETKIKRLNLGESACTTGQSLPWVKSKTFTTTFSDNTN